MVEQAATAEEVIEVANELEAEVSIVEPEQPEDVPAESSSKVVRLAEEVKDLRLEDEEAAEAPLVNGNHKTGEIEEKTVSDVPVPEHDDTLETKGKEVEATAE